MKIKRSAIFMATAFYCLGYGVPSVAGQKLDEINTKVELQSAKIDEKHGVLLDYQERNSLKLDLIAKQVWIDAGNEESVKQIADEAYIEYGITDLTEQRSLLIKIQAQKSTGHGGPEPDYP